MIGVERTVHIFGHRVDQAGGVTDASYASADRDILLQSVEVGGEAYVRRSEDDGQTWERLEDWVGSERLGENRTLTRGLPACYLDPATGRLLRIYSENEEVSGVLPWDPASLSFSSGRNFIQYSDDAGLTWSRAEQIIQQGDGFDAEHWAGEIWLGKNSAAMMTDSMLTRSDGTMLLPFYSRRIPDDGEVRYKGRNLYLVSHNEEVGALEWQVGCFLGRWRDDGSGIDWDMSDHVRVAQTNSIDGADEPGVCELPDGRMFMTIRTRTFPDSDVEVPGCKHYAVSEDGGVTWTSGQVLRYEDRGAVYSPASFARTFVSSKNGRVYVIANFADLPCYNCDPRTKLQIAEVNMDTLRVIRDSVTSIDEWHEGQQESIRFSNFAWHEGRHTGNMLLYMTPAPGPTGTWAEGDVKDTPRGIDVQVPPHCYRYEICLPC